MDPQQNTRLQRALNRFLRALSGTIEQESVKEIVLNQIETEFQPGSYVI